MAGYARTGAAREVLVVLALAATGLFLAGLVAFSPWYAALTTDRSPIVEMHAPDRSSNGTGLTAADGG